MEGKKGNGRRCRFQRLDSVAKLRAKEKGELRSHDDGKTWTPAKPFMPYVSTYPRP